MKRLLTIAVAGWLLCALPVAAGQLEWDHGLLNRLSEGASYSVRALGFGTRTEAADAPGNPDNRILEIAGEAGRKLGIIPG